MNYDVVNMHPLPNTSFAGKGYDMGDFMSKQLRLRDFRDYCVATYDAPKPLNQDEDNIASQYKDEEGWTIHRKRAWTVLLTGNHYDYIDFSIVPMDGNRYAALAEVYPHMDETPFIIYPCPRSRQYAPVAGYAEGSA